MMHAPAQQPPFRQVRPNGRLHEPSVPEADVRMAVLCHLFVALGSLSGFLLLVPPVLWLTGRAQSAFLDDHGREACNFILSMLLFAALLAVTIFGLVVAWVPILLLVIMPIRAAVLASHREFVRYPMTIRFLP